ncbi:glutathione-regulated potassium-efflux system oxidoreductase KefF [Pseudozobellia thermophila]|uniref:Glutathione-regulated potassium-efflux system ancillary protein KefG n=1 Tax=Pseudozobellia thermophila TaxID=192903 RepID=A0A1M6KRU6_9FLAO|nr:NAD(P)H-dependent oxidoreductase [Pseudozobellia thermophila]SHJ61647.1 glutathione-regulated potassium-efflux system ancillary protein KefG [Pseudozobellia thermophila]
MNSILILFAHPKFEQSRTNKALVRRIESVEGLTFHDLYERYPDFHIDISYEKELLAGHDIVIWHHPMYWYSCPPLLKQWIDLVLEYGWAYGPKGTALKAKKCLNVITTGGTRALYCAEGRNHYSVNEFLRPFEQTARLCGMEYLPPFAVMGTHELTDAELERETCKYEKTIRLLQQGGSSSDLKACDLLNDVPDLN